MKKGLGRLLRWGFTIGLIAGSVLWLTIRDEQDLFAALFYGTPRPLLAGGWLLLTLKGGLLRRLFCLICAIGFAGWWVLDSHRQDFASPKGEANLRTLFWNMAHRPLPNQDLQKLVNEWQPDIVGLVEVGSRYGDPNDLITNVPAGYKALKLPHGMAVIAKGGAVLQRQLVLPGPTKLIEVMFTIRGQEWHVIVADVASDLRISRRRALAEALSWAQGRKNTLVMGDFNTPLESSLLTPWHASLNHAFTDSGKGFRETWHRFGPVLTIDHIWASKELELLRTHKLWESSSDHAALLTELASPAPSS